MRILFPLKPILCPALAFRLRPRHFPPRRILA
jgi:hypothetical protein